MIYRLIVVALLAGAGEQGANTAFAGSAQDTQWYHPTGHRCPAWEYPARRMAAADSARAACRRYTMRWYGGIDCVSKRGPRLPDC